MGFIGRIHTSSAPSQNRREMGARDFIWLAALGTAARGPAGLEDICAAIDAITLGQWLPVGDLVTASVAEMVRGGHLQTMPGKATPGETGPGEADSLRLTMRGREILMLLLAQPLARPSSVFGQVGLRLKLAFLDLAPAVERLRHLEALMTQYQDELTCRAAGQECAALGRFGAAWRHHDAERLRGDLALLERLAATSATP